MTRQCPLVHARHFNSRTISCEQMYNTNNHRMAKRSAIFDTMAEKSNINKKSLSNGEAIFSKSFWLSDLDFLPVYSINSFKKVNY